MGMSISAKLLYGLWYKDLVKNMDEDAIELLDDEVYGGEWDYCSPWYDAPVLEWFIGIEMAEYIDVSGIPEFSKELRQCEDSFKVRFGRTGYVIAMQHVY